MTSPVPYQYPKQSSYISGALPKLATMFIEELIVTTMLAPVPEISPDHLSTDNQKRGCN